MKKILALLAGAAIIGGTATACAQINGDASATAKAVILATLGATEKDTDCDLLKATEGDNVKDNDVTIATADACKQLHAAFKGKLDVAFTTTFVAKDDKEAYNVGLVFKTTEKEGDKETHTFDAFVFFNAGSLKNPTKIEYKRR